MSPENKIINVHLEKIDELDYMVFEFEEEMKVCLNTETSQNELKAIFSNLLDELIQQPIKLEFIERTDYKTVLYTDVCREYIKDLNREISNVRKSMPEEITCNKDRLEKKEKT